MGSRKSVWLKYYNYSFFCKMFSYFIACLYLCWMMRIIIINFALFNFS